MFIFALGHLAHLSNVSYYIQFHIVFDLDHIGLMLHMSRVAYLNSYHVC